MTREREIINLFCRRFPQFEGEKRYLRLNLYGDVLDMRREENNRIIAVSDVPHDILRAGKVVPRLWKIV